MPLHFQTEIAKTDTILAVKNFTYYTNNACFTIIENLRGTVALP